MKKKTETALLDVYINERFAGRIADSTAAIAHLVADALPSEKVKVVNRQDQLVLTTMGCFLDHVPDQQWLRESLLPELIPLQTGEKEVEPTVFL